MTAENKKASDKAYYSRNRLRQIERQKRKYWADPETYRAKGRAQHKKHREKRLPQIRTRNLALRYGITQEQYDEAFKKQGGLCALCRRPEKTRHQNGKIRRLTVDHDHVTGRFRGLLCTFCNRVRIGKNTPAMLRMCLAYLERT